jgi:D-glycero-D-manno-heptose 1,7-bisphosphate phosphatase
MVARPRCCYHSGVNKTLNSAFPGGLQTVFLDRDGVLNEKMPGGRYVTGWDEFRILPDVLEAIRLLNQSGLRVVVVSNQRGIALGLYTSGDVEALHTRFQSLLQAQGAHLDGFYICPHDIGQCNCRKPLPGLFEQARTEFPDITAAGSVMIGDSLSDMVFARRLGMTTVFLESDPERQKHGAEEARELADMRFSSLFAAVSNLVPRLNAERHSSGSMCHGLPGNPK